MPVRFTRQLHQGDRGQDVYAMKRALAKAGYMGPLANLAGKPVAVRRLYGPFTTKAVRKFQAANKLPATGSYTQQTHRKLAPFFDAYAAQLMKGWTAPKDADQHPVSSGTRDRVIARAHAYYTERAHIAYSQNRPTQLRDPKATTALDCSGYVAACMDYAGVLPKVDWRYTNTWSQIKLGKPVDLKDARPGDVVFYGSPSHEALYLGDGQVLSMGHYPMTIYPVDYRSDRTAIRDLIGDA